MKLGVQLPEVERQVSWSELADLAKTIEDVGFGAIWVGDHLVYRREDGDVGPWEAWSTLAALAAMTERVTLGPLVAATSFHAPAMIAKKAVTIDEISAGRLVLGLGAGWNEFEYRAFGFPFDRRVSRFEEAFTIIRRLTAGETVDFAGEFYQIEQSSIRPPGPRSAIPLMVGTTGPRMLSICAPHISAWNIWHARYGNDPAALAPFLEDLAEAELAAGRPEGSIRRTAAVLVQLEGGVGRKAGDATRANSTPITGEAEKIAAELLKFADAGIEEVQLVLDPIEKGSIFALADVIDLVRTA